MKWFGSRRKRFDDDDEARIVAAIEAAEQGNRGEVRVHVESRPGGGDVLARARELFGELGMATADGTGVLLYVAEETREAAVWAGEGLFASREAGFWQEVVDAVSEGYACQTPVDGLVAAVGAIGELLDELVGGEDLRGNEIPDAVTSGD